MKQESKRALVWSSLMALLMAALWVPSAAAQEPPKKSVAPPAEKAQAGQKAPDTTEVKKLRGRLPAYYGKVVSDKQRTEIYTIQAKYNAEIEELKEQLEVLTTKRDSEVEKVLTDEQRAEVARLKGERKSRRASTAEETGAAASQ